MQMCRTAEYSHIRDQGDGALLRCARTRPRRACDLAAGATATRRADFAVSLGRGQCPHGGRCGCRGVVRPPCVLCLAGV